MDFKVAGTKNGVTAIQMDMKIAGILPSILDEALDKARTARLFILEKMNKVINQPRPHLSPYAPRIEVISIKPEKIGELIGPGGKVIQKITQDLGVQIDIKEDGTVFVTGEKEEQVKAAVREIKDHLRRVGCNFLITQEYLDRTRLIQHVKKVLEAVDYVYFLMPKKTFFVDVLKIRDLIFGF